MFGGNNVMDNIELNQIEIKIYLKNKRKPFNVVFTSKEQLRAFHESLLDAKVVKLGDLIFSTDEFRYAIIS